MKTRLITLISEKIDEARLGYIEAKGIGDHETASLFEGKLQGLREIVKMIVKEVE